MWSVANSNQHLIPPYNITTSSNKGLFTKREEDPSRRNNFLFALHAEILAKVVTKWRRKRRITLGQKC